MKLKNFFLPHDAFKITHDSKKLKSLFSVSYREVILKAS